PSRDSPYRFHFAQDTPNGLFFGNHGSFRGKFGEGIHEEPGAADVRLDAETFREREATSLRSSGRRENQCAKTFAREGNWPCAGLFSYEARNAADRREPE